MVTLKTSGEVALELQIVGADSLHTLCCGGKPWSAFASELEVRDDLRNRFYLGSQADCRVADPGNIVYTWSDADFILREAWIEDDDALKRVITIELKAGAPERSITLMELIPFPASVYGWTMWTAYEDFPADMQWIGGRKMYYGDICYGSVLPCMSFYNRSQDRGILLGVPHGEFPGGRLAFTSRDYHSDGIEVEFSNLLLTDSHAVVCPLLIAGQPGDYRCTLAFWKKRFPEFFARVVARPAEEAGPFLMTHPEFEDAEVDRLTQKFAPAWAEVHNHFSKYGEYAPEADSWESIIHHDYPKSWTGEPMTREKINRHIAKLHRNRILAMLYIQCYGDCFIPYAEAEFPQDIARDIAGNPMPTWLDCCFVSAARGTKFREHILHQIDRFLEVYPDIDGVFLDQLCYQAVDFAHADGRSAYKNRRVSNYGDSCADTLDYLCRRLHEAGRTVWANGPFNIDVAKPVDGMMSEGSGTIARTVQYMTIGGKSLLVASYASSPFDVEQMFRHCLVCGGNYSIAGSFDKTKISEYPERINFLLHQCGRLTKLLAGCQWVLEPHPFKLPGEFEGNLFDLPDGTRALTIVSRQETLVHGDVDRTPEFTVEVKTAEPIVSAVEYSIGGDTELIPEQADGKIILKVTGHRVFSVIVLKSR